jgi:ABC-2 type transport system permease protein
MLGVGVPILAGGLLVSHLATPFDLSRGALLVAAYLTYFLVWIGAGLGVSLRARSSQTALTVLLGLWIAGCLLVPRLAWTAVQRYVGVPTARQFVEALEAESGEGTGFLEQRRAIEKRLLAEYSVASANDLPLSTWGMTLFEREVDSTKRYNEQFSRLFERYEQQQRLINLVSLLCPPLALRTVSMSLAGTDASHYRDFAEAAERYRYALVQRMNRIAMESRLYNSRPTLAGGPDRPIFPEGEAQAYASVGEFLYDMPDARSAFSRVRLPAFALAAWLAGMGACLSRLFVRFDIG